MGIRSFTHRLPAAQRGPLVVFCILSLVVLLLFVAVWIALEVNTGVRAYTAGESQWSKGRRAALYHLQTYMRSGDESAWQRYQNALAVPLADRQARLLLNEDPSDHVGIRAHFERGANHPDDIGMMIYLYRWFGWQGHFSQAVDIWSQADEYILQLQDLGERIRALRQQGALTSLQMVHYRERLAAIDAGVSPLETAFSTQIGHAAREVNTAMFTVLGVTAVLLVLVGGYIMRRITADTFEAEERFRTIFERAPIGIAQVSRDGRWSDANASMAELLGVSREQLAGAHESEFLHPDDAHPQSDSASRLFEDHKTSISMERLYRRKDGQAVWVNQTLTAITDMTGNVRYLLAVIEDITESRRVRRELSHRACHDALTGLINRYEFERQLVHLIESVEQHEQPCALLYLDLDRFKVVNDSCGHIAGDAMLTQIARVIRATIRKKDTLARIGGDEFAILLEACPRDTAIGIAEKIHANVTAHQFTWKNRVFRVGISIGVLPFQDGKLQSLELLKAADAACYAAKQNGNGGIRIGRLGDTVRDGPKQHLAWLSDLENPETQSRLSLSWQAIAPAAGNLNSHEKRFEVLLHLYDNDGNKHLPDAFLATAKRHGQSCAVDSLVITLMFNWVDAHPEPAGQLEQLVININAESLDEPDIRELITQRLPHSKLSANQLCLSITTSAAAGDMQKTLTFIEPLRALGCQFALDDFTIAETALEHFADLPVDFIKIDGAMVCDLPDNPIHRAFVRCIVDVAHTNDRRVIAKQVETTAVAKAAQSLGVDYLQGSVVGKPEALRNKTPG